jgi:hypothetical protein
MIEAVGEGKIAAATSVPGKNCPPCVWPAIIKSIPFAAAY